MIDLPFYENDGNSCMQACMRTAIKFFLNKEYSLRELDLLTKRKDDYWTWTPQGVIALHELGLDVK
ncbi:MAG: hypothetical protein PHN56_05340, partial [Candidatus Nanoarchaeia archaeon]|nr:hypothetical protein [Candidatus Nanoarchaeia archaeon]